MMVNLPFLKTDNVKKSKIQPVVLLVLDGFGAAPPSEGNAIHLAQTPNYDKYLSFYPHTELIASGESVGLPANEVGNTEVGHLTMGAGRVILQDLKRINTAIETGAFFDNKAFLQAVGHVRSNNSNLHLMGLVGTGSVHASLEHLYSLIKFCKKENVQNVFLHLFTDGRDSPPQKGIELVKDIESKLKEYKIGQIASVSGRYYAMDRDRRWQRTEKVYKAIVLGHGEQFASAQEAVQASYQSGNTDEFVPPSVIIKDNMPVATVNDNDACIFFNFRVDRPRQLTMAFVVENFENLRSFDFGYDPEISKEVGEVKIEATFERGKVPQNLFFVTMTEYAEKIPVNAIAFGPETVKNPFVMVLSNSGLFQMHMAESEKERFVTYYFDGLRETPPRGEEVKIVSSPKVATYDKKPEMSLPDLVNEFKKQLSKDTYHFFVLNFANPDMVAHTGNVKATIKAIEYVDKWMAVLVDEVLKRDGTVFLTADHGNAEEMLTFPTSTFFYTTSKGEVNTDHSNNPVPFVVINNTLYGKDVQMSKGSLGDIATTILKYMNLPIPNEMTGKNLLESQDETSES